MSKIDIMDNTRRIILKRYVEELHFWNVRVPHFVRLGLEVGSQPSGMLLASSAAMNTVSKCIFLILFANAYANNVMIVTEAGFKPYHDIVEMKPGLSPTICVQKYPNGISIRCGGSSVRAPVTFFTNGQRERSEARSPFQIAGDRDRALPQEIFRWTGFRFVQPRSDGSRKVSVECRYKDTHGVERSFTREFVVAAANCNAYGGGERY